MLLFLALGNSTKLFLVISQLIFPRHKSSDILWECNNTAAFLYRNKYKITNTSHIQPSADWLLQTQDHLGP